MKYVSKECQITFSQAYNLLGKDMNHYLWNKPFPEWTFTDLENLKSGINKKSYKRHVRHQPVLVILNDNSERRYASVKSVSNKFKISQSTVSNILAGRKSTTKFLSIKKI